MKHRPKSREELLAGLRYETTEKHFVRGCRVGMMICLYVLWDYFDMEKDDINIFIDKCAEFLQAYNEGRVSIDETDRIIKEEIGIDMFGEIRKQ